jgi:serine/tyrosine/threonine adenylyltransferase
LLDAMHRNHADFTETFRALCVAARDPGDDGPLRGLFVCAKDFDNWAQRWRTRTAREAITPMARAESMQQANPAYIPRNHRVEQMIAAAVEHGNFGPFEELLQVLLEPYVERTPFAAYRSPPLPNERVLQTFCGT